MKQKNNLFYLADVDASSAGNFAGLTYSYNVPRLFGRNEGIPTRVIGAFVFLTPVGLAILAMDRDKKKGVVDSLYVLPRYRNRGIGRALLAESEEQLVEMGCDEFELSYRKSLNVQASPIETLLKKAGWNVDLKACSIFRMEGNKILKERWMNIALPSSFSFRLWKDLTEDDINSIRKKENEGQRPAGYFSPFLKGACDPASSVALLRGKEISGWNMTRKLREGDLLFDKLYVQPEYRGYGIGILLLAESISRMLKAGYSRAVFTINENNAQMMKIISKYMHGYISGEKEGYFARKYIQKSIRNND